MKTTKLTATQTAALVRGLDGAMRAMGLSEGRYGLVGRADGVTVWVYDAADRDAAERMAGAYRDAGWPVWVEIEG